MKLIGSNRLRVVAATGLQIALLAVVLWAADRAHGAGRSAIAGGVEAKMEYCLDCHGPSGQGYRGYFPIPRLAGQQTEYVKNQLQAFVEHRRTNNVMFNVAHSLSPAMIAALAADFRALNPRPIGGGPRGLIGAGEKSSERSARRQCCRVRRVPRPGGPRQRGNSAPCRSAARIYVQQIDELEQRAWPESGDAGYVGGHVASCAQFDQAASRSRRSLPQLFGVTPMRYTGVKSSPQRLLPSPSQRWRATRKAPPSAIARGATADRRKATPRHRVWPVKEPDTSSSNL